MSENEARREKSKQIGRQFFMEQDRKKGGPAEELCAATYVARIGGNPPMDRAHHDGFARAFYAAFPDLHHELELVIAEEDAVVVRFVLHGTHRGAFFGIPPTGRAIAVAAHVILRLEHGKVRELYGLFDEAGMLRQLGVLPAA